MNWISVNDRLPEEDELVFTYASSLDNTEKPNIGFLYKGVWVNRRFNGLVDVTHWCEITDPNKDERTDNR